METLYSLLNNNKHVVCLLLGNCPASGFYMPTFRNTLFHLHRQVDVRIHTEHGESLKLRIINMPRRNIPTVNV